MASEARFTGGFKVSALGKRNRLSVTYSHFPACVVVAPVLNRCLKWAAIDFPTFYAGYDESCPAQCTKEVGGFSAGGSDSISRARSYTPAL